MKQAPKTSKTMGKPTKVGKSDQHFESYLRLKFGKNAANKILASPSNMKRTYSMYLKGTLADANPEDIPF